MKKDSKLNKGNKPKGFPGQAKNRRKKKNCSRSPRNFSKSKRHPSKYPSIYTRAELKTRADAIRSTHDDYPDLNNGQLLAFHVLGCKSSEQKANKFFISVVEVAKRAGLCHRYAKRCLNYLNIRGYLYTEEVRLKNKDGSESWRNDPRGNLITLRVGGFGPPKSFGLKSKKVLVDDHVNTEPFELSPELDYEIDTLPPMVPFGEIKNKAYGLLGLSAQPFLRNRQIRAYASAIVATATNKLQAETLNRLFIQGLRKDKEQMTVGGTARALMGLFSVTAKLKTNTGGIRNPAAYLIGILEKPRDQQRGYQSLAAIVKTMPSAPIVDDKIRQAIAPATMHDEVFVRGRELFRQIEPWRKPPESKRELVDRFNPLWGEMMGDCRPLAKKDLTDRHGHWSIPTVLAVRLSSMLREKDGRRPIRSEAAYIKHLSKKDSLDNPRPYIDAMLAKAGVDLLSVAIKIAATKTSELPGSERGRRARAPEQNFHARKFPFSAIGDIFEAAAKHKPLDGPQTVADALVNGNKKRRGVVETEDHFFEPLKGDQGRKTYRRTRGKRCKSKFSRRDLIGNLITLLEKERSFP